RDVPARRPRHQNDVGALGVAALVQALAKRVDKRPRLGRVELADHQQADAPDFCWLLRARRERPRRRRTAEQRYDLATVPLMDIHSIPQLGNAFAEYRIAGDQSASGDRMICSAQTINTKPK